MKPECLLSDYCRRSVENPLRFTLGMRWMGKQMLC